MKLQFGTGVLNLPAASLSHCDTDADTLRVLLWLSSDMSLAEKPSQLAKLVGCTPKTASAALSYWKRCGILGDAEALPAMATPLESPAETPKKPLLQRADELPNYTYAELTELLEKRASVRALVDEAQQILGKIFNPSEVNILIGMLDYLGLSEESVLLLLAHCRNIDKKSMRAIEKYAYKLIDMGLTDPQQLEEEFRTVEAMRTFEGQVRKLFGMKTRAMSEKESKFLRAWISYGYGMDIVRHAYDLTVNATGEASLPYTNSILERYHANGLFTLADIERAEEEEAKLPKKSTKKDAKRSEAQPGTLGNSFDTDDFFEAALRRSFAPNDQK